MSLKLNTHSKNWPTSLQPETRSVLWLPCLSPTVELSDKHLSFYSMFLYLDVKGKINWVSKWLSLGFGFVWMNHVLKNVSFEWTMNSLLRTSVRTLLTLWSSHTYPGTKQGTLQMFLLIQGLGDNLSEISRDNLHARLLQGADNSTLQVSRINGGSPGWEEGRGNHLLCLFR